MPEYTVLPNKRRPIRLTGNAADLDRIYAALLHDTETDPDRLYLYVGGRPGSGRTILKLTEADARRLVGLLKSDSERPAPDWLTISLSRAADLAAQ